MAKSVKKTAKRYLKKLHVLTIVLMVAALLLGAVAGFFAVNYISRDDRFELCGQKTTTLPLTKTEGAAYLYTEQGVEAVCFGRDVSGTVSVKTTLEKNEQGQYVIPLTEEGVYTITYTVEALKFGEKAPNGPTLRVRVFVVKAGV